ncbi:MAG: ribokinase, partial [Dehalococcoidia bacterium]
MPSRPSIVVLGDINFDLIAVTSRFPGPGETIIGTEFYTSSGGKGGNQAVAAARLGARTKMVGRVGDDSYGREMLESMKGYGVDISGIAVEPGATSGIAHITIDGSGQNKIVIVSGANGRCDERDVLRAREVLEDAHVLMLQMALPLDVSLKAAGEAQRLGIQVVFDPAPAGPLSAEAYGLLDYLIPNETEASFLAGFPVTDPPTAMRAA